MPGFTLHNVTKRRLQPGPDGALREAEVLRRVTAEIPSGCLCLLMGPSGSGKSTLLRLLNRLDDPDEGEIRLDGSPVRQLPVLQLRRQVVLVGQQPAPFEGTVAENIAFGLKIQESPPRDLSERTAEALHRVGLPPELLTRPAERLSVGQQQRVCLARALALQPQVLLLDEPTAALDPNSAAAILELVAHLRKDLGLTVVYVTHRVGEARALGGTVLFLSAGELVETGPSGDCLSRPRSEALRAFLHQEHGGAATHDRELEAPAPGGKD